MKRGSQTRVPGISWTDPGKARLARLIEESLVYNKKINEHNRVREGEPGWLPDGERSLARLAGLRNHVGISGLINEGRQRPNRDILEPISPWIYQVKSFKVNTIGSADVDKVELDTSKTYADRWKDLALIGQNGQSFDEAIASANSVVDITPDEIQLLKNAIPVLLKIIGNDKSLA